MLNGKFKWVLETGECGGTSTELGICSASAPVHRSEYAQLFGRDRQSWALTLAGGVMHENEVVSKLFGVKSQSQYTFELDVDACKLTITSSFGGKMNVNLGTKLPTPLFVCAASTLAQASVKLISFTRYDPTDELATRAAAEAAAPSGPLSAFTEVALQRVLDAVFATMDAVLVSKVCDDVCVLSEPVSALFRSTLPAGGPPSGSLIADQLRILIDVGGLVAQVASLRRALLSGYCLRATTLLRLACNAVSRMVDSSAITYMTSVRVSSAIVESLLRFATDVVLFAESDLTQLRGTLMDLSAKAVTAIFVSKAPQLKDALKRYLSTPSVLSTFSGEFAELRSVLHFTAEACGDVVGSTAASEGDAFRTALFMALRDLWRDCVSEVVVSQLSQCVASTSGARALDDLHALLLRIDEAASIELFPEVGSLQLLAVDCVRSAYRKLASESSCGLAEVLCTQLNKLLDSSATTAFPEADVSSYASSALGGLWSMDRRPHLLSETVKLIRLLDCADDVGVFYRRHLARRLVTRRYLSLAHERSALDQLEREASQHLSLCQRMLDDVTTSEGLMKGFKVGCV